MNRHCHRIVFNKHRGQLMVVAETAQASGKAATGENSNTSGQAGFIGLQHLALHKLAVAMWLAVGVLPTAWAQIIADPNAPANQRPTVLSDSQGRPLVNIQTPSAAGLSRNTYRQFDVSTSGIVLNNSASNPWMANGVTARTILNEVNSTAQSFINGAITVNGASAQVIVANPNGISVNGGSFINTNRATLTTGTPQVINGALAGFNIRGGTVNIGANGLNNSATPFTDIMSRAVSVVGALRAQNLGITTGLQTVAYDSGLISNQDTNTYAAGALTIDTASLGGMYANNISILATEAGLGVRNQGTWQATGGQIVVTADGMLQNLGTIRADVASLATVKGHIENAGTIQGSQAVVTSSGGDTRLFGAGLQQTVGSAVVISAKGAVNLFNNASYGAARVTSTATGGQVSISADQNINLQSGTSVAAHQAVQLNSDGVLTGSDASVTSSAGQVAAVAGGGIGLSNTTVTGQQVHLETGAAFKDTAAWVSVSGGNIRGQTQTTLLASGGVQITSASGATPVSGGGNVHIQAEQATTIGAGTRITAGQHMSVMAGTALNLQATSGSTASNGNRAHLQAGGNMLMTGKSISATGSSISAGQDLTLEATEGNANIHALSNAGGTSVDRVSLSAGKDLNVSVFKGSIFATGLHATGQNINLLSNGTTSVAHATTQIGGNTQAVASVLTARNDLTVGSINSTAGASSQVQVVASNLNAGGQAKVLSNGVALLTSAELRHGDFKRLAGSDVQAGSIHIQGGTTAIRGSSLRADGNKSSPSKSGNITVTAENGAASFQQASVVSGSQTYTTRRLGRVRRTTITHNDTRPISMTSTGNIALHANGTLTHWYTQANAGGSLSSTSATGQIQSTGARLVAKDVLSFASKGAQTHTSGFYSGGAASVFNETGHLALNSTRVQAVRTTTAGLGTVSGQTSIESGGTLGVNASSALVGTTDLSIVQGQGDITLNPGNWGWGTFALSQLGYGRDLTLGTRNGTMRLNGAWGSNSYGSSSRVAITTPGSLTLFANNMHLQGSQLRANGGALKLTATTGNLTVEANKATHWRAGFTNTHWDMASLSGGAGGIDVRSAGDMQLNGLSAYTWAHANFQSGGNLTTSGKLSRWQVDNRPSAGSSYNGWYQDHEWVNYSNITGSRGVTLGAMGGHLRVSGTHISSWGGTASLQALGHVHLEAVMTDVVHNATSTGWRRSRWGRKTTWTTYHDRAWRNVNAVNVNARNIEIKAGNNVATYATRLSASNNLKIEAGDQALYYAVRNQSDHSDTTYRRKSFIGIRYDKSTEHNTTRISTPMVSHLYAANGNLTSWSGGDQMFQGTVARYHSRDIQAGVGERARADARIILQGVRTEVFKQRTKESNYVVWQKQLNQGSRTETLTLPSFTGTVNTPFKAPGGISVQIPEGEFKSQIATLSQQPGMAYLNELAARSDVNWQPVKLAHDQWDYKQEGLTPAGAALIGFAVAMATGGAGAGLLGTTGTVSTAAANAALTSLVAQASISLINNKGDVGKTLDDLGSSHTVKNMLIAAGVAGVTTHTDSWGRTLTPKGNTIVTDWAKRSQAYALNTAAKGVLTGTSSSSDWWTIAALGLAGEAYQYWAGRAADARPGVDRENPKFTPDEEGGLLRVPREQVNGILREGKNIGLNQNPCLSLTRICHGTPISNALNTLPGFNAFATLHDTWMNQLSDNTAINLGTMPPAFVLTYGNLIDQYRYINARRK